VSGGLQRIQLGGLSVAYRSAGHGPPLVLLHGFACDSRVWARQLYGLSDQFRVVAWDAPGAGTSSDPPGEFTTVDWARTLAQLIEAVCEQPAHLVGLSWGGIVAQELYRLEPTLVGSLVLADTYAGWKGSFPADIVAQRLSRCLRDSSLPPQEFAAQWVPEFFTQAAPPALLDEMTQIVADRHPRGFRLMARSSAETDTTDVLRAIAVPCLLLWGEGDVRSPLSIAHRFHEAIPGASLAVISEAGHLSNMERPVEFNHDLRRFCGALRQQTQ
jgi:pimeloyl-ACP methyl ester carboxylesterase